MVMQTRRGYMAGTLFIISAPSCAGKTTLLRELCKGEMGKHVTQYVTYTTKKPRHGDVQGKDFHFISVEEFERKLAEGFFIEWSNTYVHYYGTPRSIIDDLHAGISYIIILDRLGARKMAQVVPQAILIWVYVSDVYQLQERIRLRGQDCLEQISLRLSLAQLEMEEEKVNSFYTYHVKNDDFPLALGQLKGIIKKYITKN